MKTLILFLLSSPLYLLATESDAIERKGWFFDDYNTTKSGLPTNVQYFKYFDMLPDEIVLEIFKEKDLSALAGRKVVVGYGEVDPIGTDCRVFPAGTDGLEQDITICLPWWRIERDYQLSASTTNDLSNFYVQCQVLDHLS